MGRVVALLTLCAVLSGCGVAETGIAGGAAGASQAQQAAEARKTEDRVKQQVDAAVQQADEQRRAAEESAK
jgi:hypothetical protein